MSYTAHHKDFAPYESGKLVAERVSATPQPSLLRRFVDAIFRPRQTQIERDIAAMFASSGGRITDDLERRMTERIASTDWNMRF